jgi:hypothetical protein
MPPVIRLLLAVLVALPLVACDLVGTVGNPGMGFTIQFPAKWQSTDVKTKLPDFVQQASRFKCDFDRCGRLVFGVGLYGRLPAHMSSSAGVLPQVDDVVALVDQMLDLRGNLRERHVLQQRIGPSDGYHVRFVLPGSGNLRIVVRANIVFHDSRFLFYSVSAKLADEDRAERLLDELTVSMRRPAATGA